MTPPYIGTILPDDVYFLSTTQTLTLTDYSKTSLKGPTTRPTLKGKFKEVVNLGSWNTVTMVLYGQLFGTQIKRLI